MVDDFGHGQAADGLPVAGVGPHDGTEAALHVAGAGAGVWCDVNAGDVAHCGWNEWNVYGVVSYVLLF